MLARKHGEYNPIKRRERYLIHWQEERAKQRAYNEKNKSVIRENHKQYYQTHKKEISVKNKRDRKENPEKFKLRKRKSYVKNKEKRNESSRHYYRNNKQQIARVNKLYYYANIGKKKAIAKHSRFLHKEQRNRKHRERIKKDTYYRLGCNLRSRIGIAVKRNYKSGSAIRDLGCTIPELKFYLEGKFQDGMTWENREKWHIDHIIPLAYFDLTDREQFLKACHYTNLQPLWAIDNLKKGTKVATLVC